MILGEAQPNNGMHPTRDTLPVIKRNHVGGRVMPGVSWLPYMPVHIAIGLKAPSIEPVSEALRLATGHTPEPHESLYLGEYDLFRLPEEVQVKYNFVAAEGEWDYPAHQDYGILIVAGETERPEYVRELATGLGYESSVLEESKW